MDISHYCNIIKYNQDELKDYLKGFLSNYYTEIIDKPNYLMAIGGNPIALVAHLDTVFSSPPVNIFYDPTNKVLFSPQGGVGDDRSGVFAIMDILLSYPNNNNLPTVIFCKDEECGGIGASDLTEDYKDPPAFIKFIIEIDRRGDMECVFYGCHNKAFEEYIQSFGFHLEYGSFSDISIICPDWDVAGVNVSAGYFNEHEYREYLNINAWKKTINAVKRILEDPNSLFYSYIGNGEEDFEYITCDCCGEYVRYSDTCPVSSGETVYNICWDCLDELLKEENAEEFDRYFGG